MNQAPGHATDQQIKSYVTGATTDPGMRKWLDAHVTDCQSCLGRLLDAERIHLGLLEGDGMKQTPYPGCPAEEILQELAAGICAPDIAEKTTEHAAHCNHCGPILSCYLKEFSEDIEDDDAALLGQLESAMPKWQRKFVRDHLIAEAQRRRRSIFGGLWPRLVTATSALAVAVAGFLFYLHPSDLSQAQQLVAAAYQEQRTTEMRLPEVPYAGIKPPRVERGSDSGSDLTSELEPILRAQLILDKKRKSGELDAQWLDIEGRISLLRSRPDSRQAMAKFEKALVKDPANPRLQIDLAAGYFEEEIESEPDHPDLRKTTNLLNEALKNPKLGEDDRAVALFDLAIAYQKSELWDLAIREWQEYLRIRPSGPWAAEAQKNLEDATKKKQLLPVQQGFKDPAFFLQGSSTSQVRANIEPYQDLALSTWLPAAVENPSSDASRAVTKLADLMEQQHSDPWWRDFLRALRPGDLPAVRALGAAFVANRNDLSEEALQQSNKAAEWFGKHGNVAGELRARFEQVYALQRELASSRCIATVEELSRRVLATQYRWLQAQTSLEQATCASWVSDYDTMTAAVAFSRNLADQYKLPELGLRVVGLDATEKRLQRKYDEAWKQSVAGLHSYWQGLYSPERLFQFYAVMYLSAQQTNAPYAAEALMRQAIAIRQSNFPDDLDLLAVLFVRLANVLSEIGEVTLADEMNAKGISLLKQIPAGERSAQRAVFVAEIQTAEIALKHGHADLAFSGISSVRELLQMQDDFINLDFYRILGHILRQRQQFDAAASAYKHAIGIAEHSLNRMQDDVSRVRWVTATDDTYRGLTQTLLAQRQDREALAIWERFKDRSLEREHVPNFSLPSALQNEISVALLPPVSQPHLIYASFENSLQMWFVNGSVIKSRSFAITQDNLRQQVRDFLENCANPDSPVDKVQRQAEDLYKLLLQPFTEELSSTTRAVAIELDQPLNNLAMEALRSADGQYFGNIYSTIYSPGLLVENTLRPPLPLQFADSLLLVDASPTNGSGRLPGHVIEQDSVTHTFPHRTLMTGSDLTPARVKQALKNSMAFDFIGHAKPEGTGTALVLTPDASLKASDFSPDIIPKLRFAVFAACSSGSAKDGLLDTGSLLRSFFAARVPSVVASHWNVDSQSTAEFMKSFYAQLAQGEPVATALRSARRQMHSAKNHPYYWAAFSLSGKLN